MRDSAFFGGTVVRATFVLAMFGWGVGFYGPPIYLAEIVATHGWPLALVSAAVTVHFLAGVLVVARLPRLYARFGLARVTAMGALLTALGVVAWSLVTAPWQLFGAALLSGAGWVALAAVAVNAIIARWYARGRPAALSKAYNGASLGGVVFSPLWVALIGQWGFRAAALAVGAAMVLVVGLLAWRVFALTPQQLGQALDGAQPAQAAAAPPPAAAAMALRHDRRFITLALSMALGLFAQIGLLAHLFKLAQQPLGAQAAGWLMGSATACAVAGRYLGTAALARLPDRRLVAAGSYLAQACGAALLAASGFESVVLLCLGVWCFGAGIGNATSLPPLIAQQDFAAGDVARVVAAIVALSQAAYAFAPLVFGAVQLLPGGQAWLPLLALALQLAAALLLWRGRALIVAART
ncbi:oxalate/formate antiporter [Bordetella hinzii]|uniref:MFS transporter n=1 Tax=Bordetella hinzii TaxID=103855 RepID=UPI000414AB1C|nr:MFS transporter [Bordetella hinzii]AKQ56891.1 Major Facilitator Superfamily protein [Bordetella hinzii]KCB26317.1 transporter, major facilitator family protein [Bordetella hinzii L60]SNV68513.1 oxalate/formate antiporter [Bordetella hinzii]